MIYKAMHSCVLSALLVSCGSEPLKPLKQKKTESSTSQQSSNSNSDTIVRSMDEFTLQLNSIDIENEKSFDDSNIGILSVNPIVDDSAIAQEVQKFKNGCSDLFEKISGDNNGSDSSINQILIDQGASAKSQFMSKCEAMFDAEATLDLLLSGKPAVFMGAAVGFKVGNDALIKTVFSGMDVIETAKSLAETTGSCTIFNRPAGQGLGECLLGRIQAATLAGTVASFDFELPVEDSPLLDLIPANVGVGAVGALIKAGNAEAAGVGAAGGVVGVFCGLGKGMAFAAGGAAGAVYSAITSGQAGATGWAGAAEFACPQGIQ